MQLPTATVLLSTDSRFPALLSQINDCPTVLYCYGNIERLNEECLAVVGSRSMSSYGRQLVSHLLPAIAQFGITVVSGLAYGVDAEAHRVTLKHGGRCVAVLGSGFERFYPQRNLGLALEIIAAGGCVLTEYAPTVEARPFFFPARNRIIAGLCRATLVVEAGEGSGTIITAELARDYNREVCAVPANIFTPHAAGVHGLLKRYIAQPVTDPEDMLALYPNFLPGKQSERGVVNLTGQAAAVYDLISQGTQQTNALCQASGIDIAQLQCLLTKLELDGYITGNADQWQKT